MNFIDVLDAVHPQFAELMMMLAAPYPTARLTDVQIQTYARALSRYDLSLDDVRLLFARAVTECRFFPSIAELLQLMAPSGDDAGLIAWTALNQAVATVGPYGNLVVEDGAAAAALEAVFGSWSAFCAVESGPELAMKRQEFLALYRNMRRQGTWVAKCLPGLCEGLARLTWSGRILLSGQVQSEREQGQIVGGVERAIMDGDRNGD